jgi:hypothetical protein
MGVGGQFHAPAAFVWERTPITIESQAGWALETVWTYWGSGKYVASAGIRASVRTVGSLASIKTALSADPIRFCIQSGLCEVKKHRG